MSHCVKAILRGGRLLFTVPEIGGRTVRLPSCCDGPLGYESFAPAHEPAAAASTLHGDGEEFMRLPAVFQSFVAIPEKINDATREFRQDARRHQSKPCGYRLRRVNPVSEALKPARGICISPIPAV